MPAVPIIGLGISAVSAYKSAKNASSMANSQKDLMRQQSGLSNEMASFAREQHTMAEPALQKAMQYYMQLATGNRAAIQGQLAPDIARLTETYRGAERGLEAKTAPGPSRDRAIAELYRQRAGQLGIMPFEARRSAVGDMAQLGGQRMNAALDAYGRAGSALTGASQAGTQAFNMGERASDRYGSMISAGTQAAQDAWNWYRNRAPKPLTTIQTTPGSTTWMPS